ncbi:MAG TPA: GAF domain-containing protein, partial [Terriglobia bacterium]|nr:GAF domain-containing protein [Terriglobia bacterium]
MPIGKTAEAIQALEQVHRLDPKDESAQLALGQAYLAGGQFAKVLALWKELPEEKTSQEILSMLVKANLAEKQTQKAEAQVWKLIPASPEALGLLFEVARQYVELNQNQAVARLLKQVEETILRSHPSHEWGALVQKLASLPYQSIPALESLARLLDRLHYDSPLAEVLNRLFDQYFDSQQYAGAGEVLERLIDIDPYNPEATAKLKRLEGKADSSLLRELYGRLEGVARPSGISEGSASISAAASAMEEPPPEGEAAGGTKGAEVGTSSLKDLMLQAEIFMQYGMEDKARERMERIAKLFPGEENRNKDLARLYKKIGVSPAPAPAAESAEIAAPVAESRDFQADLKRVSEISRDLSRQSTVKSILYTAVNEIGKHWQVSRCVVGLATPKRPPTMAMEYLAQGIPASDATNLGKLVMGLQQANAGKTRPLVAENAAESPAVAGLQETLKALRVDSLVAVPLRDGDQEIGMLVLEQCGQRRSWRGNDLAALEALAEQVVLAIANVRLRNLMKALAVTDESSGLLHRDSYITCLLSEAERMRTQKSPLSVVLLYFSLGDGQSSEASKAEPQLRGAANGKGLEEFLQKFAGSIMSQLRQNDMAVKYGSNTLALILPGALGKDATTVAAKMRRLAAATAGDSPLPVPRMAAGIAEAIREGAMDSTDRVTELINRAERALDEARREGPEAVKILEPPVLPR